MTPLSPPPRLGGCGRSLPAGACDLRVHSSATDINKSSTSGFTLLSAAHPPLPPPTPPSPLLRLPLMGVAAGWAWPQRLMANLNFGQKFIKKLTIIIIISFLNRQQL